ncbi:MAG: Tat (Twin-arginine translocation) pathway signal sequence [Rhodospirillales bacterium]|nr:Tat (Twin-arginine translocation) pathway signal sequence [Rhodospirillales bacterium]
MTTRREFLAGAAVVGAAATGTPFLIGASRAAEPMVFVLPLSFVPDFIDVMNAYSGGHFARQGIDAKLIGATSGAQGMQLLVTGQAQFGRGSALDEIRAAAQKSPPIGIATINQGSSFRIISLQDRPVQKAEDFKGKTVGIISNGSPTEIFLDLMLAKVGLNKSDAERQATGGTAGAIEYLKKGRVDCFISSLSVVVALEQAGEKIVYWSTDRYAPMPGNIYMTTPEVVVARPDLVVHCLHALKASIDELMTQPTAPLFERAAKDFDIPGLQNLDTQVVYLRRVVAEAWLSQGRENLLRNIPSLWASGVEALRSAAIVDIKDPTGLYTNRFIDEALRA